MLIADILYVFCLDFFYYEILIVYLKTIFNYIFSFLNSLFFQVYQVIKFLIKIYIFIYNREIINFLDINR